jgi:hypothetical protein
VLLLLLLLIVLFGVGGFALSPALWIAAVLLIILLCGPLRSRW